VGFLNLVNMLIEFWWVMVVIGFVFLVGNTKQVWRRLGIGWRKMERKISTRRRKESE